MTGKTRNEMVSQIEKDMHTAATCEDTEGGHMNADDLLIEMLRTVGKGTKYASRIEDFVKTYHSVGKWYA